ncbi:hypothetical protein HCH_03154 [Hahella chejuensis KCTC 2396]|uniref:Uncharacterized protein n=1 Tax=Hahella chejuensis (strain KCTC 2396) TaxID=349521 RepID=Q2SHF8_HAHCH|nr:hypothetical protein [Hahella chejuensis]ABC29916.1 hypothetical protein HCH_03154 [Hahella chejuensis KCTC 2396]
MNNALLIDEAWSRIGVTYRKQEALTCINGKMRQLSELESDKALSEDILRQIRICKNWMDNLKRHLGGDDHITHHCLTTDELKLLEKMVVKLNDHGS